MSELKHLSVGELRDEVNSLSKYREKLERQWVDAEAQIEKLHSDIKQLRAKHHNMGQREAWARLYLARKT